MAPRQEKLEGRDRTHLLPSFVAGYTSPSLFLMDERKGCNKRRTSKLARESQAAQKKQGSISVICIYDITTKQQTTLILQYLVSYVRL